MKTAGSSSRDKGRGGKFVYKKPDAAKLKEHADQQGGAFDSIFKSGIDTFRAKQGDNTIRILPPTWEDQDHYSYLIWVHRRIGSDNSTYICPLKMKGDPCPICEASREAKEAGEEEEAKALNVQKTYACWVIDRDDKKPVPLLYHMSWTMDRDIASICQNKKTGATLFVDHPDEGYDITFTRKGTNLNTKYFGHQVDREATPIDESSRKQDDIIEFIQENSIPDLLKVREYDYLEQVLKGKKAKSDDDEDADEKPKRRSRDDDEDEKPKRRTRDDDDEDEKPAKKKPAKADDEDEDEDEKPAKRRSRDKDEDEDERPAKKRSHDDDEDEDEKPARSRREDDEDEKPKRKARDAEDDEDERPAKRKAARDDEDEDERPAKKRSRDDDEDAPRVRRK